MKILLLVFGVLTLSSVSWATASTSEGKEGVYSALVDTTDRIPFVDTAQVNELFALAVRQRGSGLLQDAQQTFLRVTDLQPDYYAAQYELARTSLELQDFSTAQTAAEIASQGQPHEKEHWDILLEVYRLTSNLAAMPTAFRALSEIEPENPAHYYSEAYVYFLQRDYKGALAGYERAREYVGVTEDGVIGESEVYIAMEELETAIDILELFLQKTPETPRPHMMLAELYTATDKPRRALATLNMAAKRFPDEGVVLLSRADTYLAMGRERQAQESLEEAFAGEQLDIDAKANVLYTIVNSEGSGLSAESVRKLTEMVVHQYPQEPRAYAIKGDIYLQLNEVEEARLAYLKAVDINMYLEPIWQQLLQTELQLGLHDQVEEHGVSARALFPNNPVISFFTGHGFLGNKKYTEARRLFEHALNNADQDNVMLMAQLYSSLGDVYNALGMHAESDVAYEETIILDSTNAYALNNYAYYLALRKERLDRAEDMAKRAVKLQPNVEHYEDTYAWVLFRLERYDEALVWIQRAMQSADEPSEVLYEHYGDILAMNGEIDKAVAQWKRALAIADAVGKDIDALSKKINERQYVE